MKYFICYGTWNILYITSKLKYFAGFFFLRTKKKVAFHSAQWKKSSARAKDYTKSQLRPSLTLYSREAQLHFRSLLFCAQPLFLTVNNTGIIIIVTVLWSHITRFSESENPQLLFFHTMSYFHLIVLSKGNSSHVQ